MDREERFWEYAFAALAILAAVPLWTVEHLPVQDLPQHLAAIRILHDHGSPELGFSQFFEIHLGRTQYLTYYLLADWLSYAVGLIAANKLIFTAAIVGLPYSAASLLKALGRDERLALLLLPFAYNAHLLHGFVNFAAAIPLMLWGVALAVRLRHRWEPKGAMLLGALALLTFYTHVVPFGVLVLASVLVAVSRDRRAVARRLLPFGPALAAVVLWLWTSPAAKTLLSLAQRDERALGAEFWSLKYSLKEVGHWLFDVLRSNHDGKLLVAWAALMAAVLLFADPASEKEPETDEERVQRTLVRRLSMLAPLAFVVYLFAPVSYDWIWPINARFPIIGVVFFVISLPRPRPQWQRPLYGAAAALALAFFLLVGLAFRSYARDEARGLDAAIASIPPGQKVAGLMFDRRSEHFEHAPFLHSVALYQAARGGVVMFTFALMPSSPVSFKPEAAPPRVRPRWEWSPEQVRPVPDLDWYDYVMTRADPGVMRHNEQHFEQVFEGNRWAVWKRRRQ